MAFGVETVDVDHGQFCLRMRSKELLLAVVETYEGVEEGGGCGG